MAGTGDVSAAAGLGERVLRLGVAPSQCALGRQRAADRPGSPELLGERLDLRQQHCIAPNLLEREFTAEGPNQRWVADFTYVPTAEGWLYVAVVLDLYSRRIVGWPMKPEMTAQLVVDALMRALWRRGKPRELLHHSDQGSQPGFNESSQHRVCRPSVAERRGPRRAFASRGSCVAACSRQTPRPAGHRAGAH